MSFKSTIRRFARLMRAVELLRQTPNSVLRVHFQKIHMSLKTTLIASVRRQLKLGADDN
ncbi:MAG: hypothetical protein Q7R22_007755 [Verrucomicrobiota bacterium JB025]|nr:hypothetical protein [Verrucomicrobiota bacterium JB025]